MRFFTKTILLSTFILTICSLANAFDQQHSQLTEVLKKHVKMSTHASQVNYEGLKSDQATLKSYLQSLSQLNKSDFSKFSESEKISFLINAYNAFTLKLVIDNYPVKSIRKIGGLFSSPWKIEFIQLLGEKVSLDKIEHEMLRKDYNEPRVHFAVNCASIGCPRLLNAAYTAKDLNNQLNSQAKAFLTDTSRNSIDWKKKVVKVSKIFSWFEDDFTKNNKTVLDFVLPYMLEDQAKRTLAKDFELAYTDYDWDLNNL